LRNMVRGSGRQKCTRPDVVLKLAKRRGETDRFQTGGLDCNWELKTRAMLPENRVVVGKYVCAGKEGMTYKPDRRRTHWKLLRARIGRRK
jgi:hypothetical protein